MFPLSVVELCGTSYSCRVKVLLMDTVLKLGSVHQSFEFFIIVLVVMVYTVPLTILPC